MIIWQQNVITQWNRNRGAVPSSIPHPHPPREFYKAGIASFISYSSIAIKIFSLISIIAVTEGTLSQTSLGLPLTSLLNTSVQSSVTLNLFLLNLPYVLPVSFTRMSSVYWKLPQHFFYSLHKLFFCLDFV